MGLFAKLFGGGSREDDFEPAQKPREMEPVTLRTARNGGYDKTETLMLLDRLGSELLALEEARDARAQGMSVQLPPEFRFDMPSQVSAGGFDEADTEAYLNDLGGRIARLRAELI